MLALRSLVVTFRNPRQLALRIRGRVAMGRYSRISSSVVVKVRGKGSIKIGTRTVIDPWVVIEARNATVRLGNRCYVGHGVHLIAFANLEIGDDVRLAERVSIHTEDHGPAGSRDQYRSAPVRIGSLAWVGANAVITKGVVIGEGATIGAGAVVTRDVPPYEVWGGVPARRIRS